MIGAALSVNAQSIAAELTSSYYNLVLTVYRRTPSDATTFASHLPGRRIQYAFLGKKNSTSPWDEVLLVS